MIELEWVTTGTNRQICKPQAIESDLDKQTIDLVQQQFQTTIQQVSIELVVVVRDKVQANQVQAIVFTVPLAE